LTQKKVIFIAEMEIECGPANRSSFQDFLQRDLIHRFFLDQRNQSVAKAFARALNARIGLAAPLFALLWIHNFPQMRPDFPAPTQSFGAFF
jgi:hypothetical protein